MNYDKKTTTPDANPDPLTGEPGAHPVGVGVGSVGGAAAGAAMGSLAGPVGTVLGAAIGGVAGALAGKGVAESIDPTLEDAYWRENYATRSYVKQGATYETYQPAYQFGWESRGRYGELNWGQAEPQLREDWSKRGPNLSWNEAQQAAQDAWDRIRPGVDYKSENR